MPPLEAHRRLRLANLAIKAYDLLDHLRHSTAMKWAGLRLRLRKWRLFRGDVRSILVVRIASLGDVVRATSVVGALKRKHPLARIDFLTTRGGQAVLRGNPDLGRTFHLEDLDALGSYDWVCNLQSPDPPPEFFAGTALGYDDVLERLGKVPARLYTGRSLRLRGHIDLWYCHTEVEEHFRIALLPYTHADVARTRIVIEEDPSFAERVGIGGTGRRVVGLFIGSQTTEGGHDGGFRSYSIDYLDKLAEHFSREHQIVFFGQASVKTPEEAEEYRQVLARYPDAIDLVDRTTLPELFCAIKAMDLVVTSDSSPLHLAMALKTPVVALFVNTAGFRLHPGRKGDGFVGIEWFRPCFKYNWRWKFFCGACEPRHYAMYGCNLKSFGRKQDMLPVARVAAAAETLNHARKDPRDDS